MKSAFVSLLFLFVFITQIIGQEEKFDIASYLPPKDWTKDINENFVTYTKINQGAGSFCLLTIYKSIASKGDPGADFKSQWADLVALPFNADANPKTELRSDPGGWSAVGGACAAQKDSLSFYMVLTVFSGFGKTISVLAKFNDKAYINDIDALLKNIKLDKSGIPQDTKPVGQNTGTMPAQSTTQKNSPPETFGSVLYSVPKGWQVKKYSNADVLSPGDLSPKEVLEIRILKSLDGPDNPEQALEKSFDEAVTMLQATEMNEVNGGHYNIQPVKKSFRGWDYIRCSGGIQVNNGTPYPDEFGLDLFVVKVNNRYERVAIVKSRNNCNLSRYYPSDRLDLYYDIENFLFNLQFADWKDASFKTAGSKGGGITGVWEGITLRVGTPKPGAQLGAELKTSNAIFFSNGQVYFGTRFPTEGLDEINTLVRAELNRRDWGTYTFSNGKGVMTLPYGELPMRMENTKLIITTNKTDHGFIKLNPVDGARFNGTYAFSSKNIFGEETGKVPSINFTADGKFTDNGAMSIMYHEYIDCLNLGKEPGSGTYEVKNHSIIFNYSNGKKIKIAFPGIDFDKGNQSPATIIISSNDDELMRK